MVPFLLTVITKQRGRFHGFSLGARTVVLYIWMDRHVAPNGVFCSPETHKKCTLSSGLYLNLSIFTSFVMALTKKREINLMRIRESFTRFKQFLLLLCPTNPTPRSRRNYTTFLEHSKSPTKTQQNRSYRNTDRLLTPP